MTRCRLTLLISALGASGFASAQTFPTDRVDAPEVAAVDRVPEARAWWVEFGTKLAPGQSLNSELDALRSAADPRQIARRQLRRTDAGLFDERDLPVRSDLIASVESTGARVRAVSRWMNSVSVEATASQRDAILRVPGVRAVRPVASGLRHRPDTPERTSDAAPAEDTYGLSSNQLTQINLVDLHAQGVTGAGIRIGVLDTGFVTTHEAFNNPAKPLQIVAARDFINNDADVGIQSGDSPDQHRHGTWILGTLASYKPGTLIGAAHDAEYVLCKTEVEDSETPVEEDYYVAGIEFAESLGCDVVTSSLGYIDWYTQADLDGQTPVTTRAVNIATANGVHCVTAAGNSGNDLNPATSRLGAPGDAPRAITCGAVNLNGAIASFSSDGPTADGRVKPELLARGVDTYTVSSSTNTGYPTLNGTSLSTPLVAGAVACLTQSHPGWTPDQMRRALFQTAAGQGVPDPLYVRGYGILNAAAAAAFPICPADLNANDDADLGDFLLFFNCYDPLMPCADVNADSVVDFGDFLYFFSEFDAGC